MLNKALKISLSLFFVFISVSSFSQSKKIYNKGEAFIKKNRFVEAVTYFKKLDSAKYQSDYFYNYYLGVASYNLPINKQSCIPFFEKYLDLADSALIRKHDHENVYFILGDMYHLLNEFSKANEYLKQYYTLIETKESLSKFKKEKILIPVSRKLEQCKYGEIALENPRNVKIINLSDGINSIYPDYAPVVSSDEKKLYFTSKRPIENTNGKPVKVDRLNEDIFVVDINTVEDEDALKTGVVKRIGNSINTYYHDSGIQLSGNDSVLYFYRNSDIWEVNLYDTLDGLPKKLNSSVNTKEQESSIFFSFDNSKLFIVSDRPGGFGGLDIYVSKKDVNGMWGTAVNLGPNVNTEFDEETPFLDRDGETLYFSSKGNSSIGGYDIFRTKLTGDSCSFPVNLGFPINTASDDICFNINEDQSRAFYSSGDISGIGYQDIYRISFEDKRDPIAELNGFIKKGKELVPSASSITLTSVLGDEMISEVSDSLNGEYFLLLGHGKEYDMKVEMEGFALYERRFSIPEQKEYFQLYQEIRHDYIYGGDGAKIGQKITVFNAMGDSDSTINIYDSLTLNQIDLLKKELNYTGNIQAITDIKFYISKDSLKALMMNDKSLKFKLDANSNVSFNENGEDVFDLASYEVHNVSLSRKVFLDEGISIEDGSELEIANTESVNEVDGLFFTVQVGVYANPVAPSFFKSISELNNSVTEQGYIRYTTGRFDSVKAANVRREEAIKKGIVDAYVTVYYNGKRITIAEASEILITEGNTILNSNK